MEEKNSFPKDFQESTHWLRTRDQVAELRLARGEDPEKLRGIMQAIIEGASEAFARTKQELLRKPVSDDALRVIGKHPFGFHLVLREMKDTERYPLIWELFELSTSEVDLIRDPEDGIRKRYLGILEGIMLFCNVCPPEPEELVMGGEKMTFYNWEHLRSQVVASGKV